MVNYPLQKFEIIKQNEIEQHFDIFIVKVNSLLMNILYKNNIKNILKDRHYTDDFKNFLTKIYSTKGRRNFI